MVEIIAFGFSYYFGKSLIGEIDFSHLSVDDMSLIIRHPFASSTTDRAPRQSS